LILSLWPETLSSSCIRDLRTSKLIDQALFYTTGAFFWRLYNQNIQRMFKQINQLLSENIELIEQITLNNQSP